MLKILFSGFGGLSIVEDNDNEKIYLVYNDLNILKSFDYSPNGFDPKDIATVFIATANRFYSNDTRLAEATIKQFKNSDFYKQVEELKNRG